jgi:hypothetical protein
MPLPEQDKLIVKLEKRLGRELSPAERRLLALADEVMRDDQPEYTSIIPETAADSMD